jgi:hypothetical protein
VDASAEQIGLNTRWNRHAAASVLQASGFPSDVTVFRLNATGEGESGSPTAFRRNTAERVYAIEAAHNAGGRGFKSRPRYYKRPR